MLVGKFIKLGAFGGNVIPPSLQTGTCRTTASRVIKLRESQSIAGKPIQGERFNLALVATNVRIALSSEPDDGNVRHILFASSPRMTNQFRNKGAHEIFIDER